jgi:hypothetical protein
MHEFTGVLRAANQMEWIVKKGQNLSTSSDCHGKFQMVCYFWPNQNRLMTVNLMASNADTAPHRSKHSVSTLCSMHAGSY